MVKDAGAQKATIEVLKIFDGASYKFALEVLKAARFYLDAESKFDVGATITQIKELDKSAKKKS